MLLHGIFPPITTPFYPDGNVYFKSSRAMSSAIRERLALALLCSLDRRGHPAFRSGAVRCAEVRARGGRAEQVLIAGTGIESASETLRLTEYAAGLGYDVAMVRTPRYYKKQMQPATFWAFYRTVADRSPLP